MTDQDIGLFKPTDEAITLVRKIAVDLDGAKITDVIQALGLIIASTAKLINRDPDLFLEAVSAYCALSVYMLEDDNFDGPNP